MCWNLPFHSSCWDFGHLLIILIFRHQCQVQSYAMVMFSSKKMQRRLLAETMYIQWTLLFFHSIVEFFRALYSEQGVISDTACSCIHECCQNGKNGKNTRYSHLGVFTDHTKVLSPGANLVVTPDKKLKLAAFVVLCIGSCSLPSVTRYKQTAYSSYKTSGIDCISVNTVFLF